MPNLLPPNATTVEINLDETFDRIGLVPTPARKTINPDEAPSEILPWLAWARSVDNWDANWTDEQKRSVIKAAYSVHRQKGTIGALKMALAAFGYKLVVQEWYQQIPQGDPYTFDVTLTVNDQELSAATLKRLLSVINSNKNLRSHLRRVRLNIEIKSNLYCAATQNSGHDVEFIKATGGLYLDGTWQLDGTKRMNGVDM